MIYIHIPFCRSFCTYCDFYSELACKGKDAVRIELYIEDLCAEIAARRAELLAYKVPNTLYIGGGTPSVLPLSALSRILEALGNNRYEELTVEVNPEDIVERGLAYVEGLKALGVNRISMGVQAFDDALLRWMNRRHDAARAESAFRLLRQVGIDNISIDLIFGISHQSEAQLLHSLDMVGSLRPEHLSAYQLSIEAGSALAQLVARGEYMEASQEQCAAQYELICKHLAQLGYEHYEISNWALPGYRAKHNSAYWTRKAYIGFGPGAHSFDGYRKRSWNSDKLGGWTSECELLSDEEIREETLMLGMRTADGVDASLCQSDDLLAAGKLEYDAARHRIRIPEEYFFTSDDIIASLI